MTHQIRTLVSCLLASTVLLANGLGAQGPQAPPYRPSRPIAIVGGLLIDGTGGPPRQDQTVLIEGERITQVGPSERVTIPDRSEIIDASGMTVTPGLVNSNQHLQLNPLYPAPTASLPLANIKARWELTWSREPQRAFVYLMQGITSMRNTSGPAKQLLPIKQAIDRGELPGPRVFLGGALFMSKEHFISYIQSQHTPHDAVEYMRSQMAYNVITDPDKDTDAYLGPESKWVWIRWQSSRLPRVTGPKRSEC